MNHKPINNTRMHYTRRTTYKRILTSIAVCIALLNVLGFVVSFSLMTWFIVAVLFRRPQRIAIALAAGGAVAIYAVFSLALGVALPTGLLF